MENTLERGFCPSSGLSFFDWDGLDDEECIRLNQIINTPSEHAGVQLPFSKSECGDAGSKHPTELSVQPAPVFQPGVPPPSMVGYPIPVQWAHGNAPPGNPFSGYVFPGQALTANGETPVAFVNGHPVYAFPGMGHPIPAHYQGPPPPLAANGAAIPPITGHLPADLAIPPPNMAHHTLPPPITMPPGHVAITESMIPAGPGIPPVTLQHNGPVVYIPQSHPLQPQQVEIPSNANNILPSQSYPDNTQVLLPSGTAMQSVPTELSQAAVHVKSISSPASSAIQFGGPVLFDSETLNISSSSQLGELNNNKVSVQLTEPVSKVSSQVVINVDNLSITDKEDTSKQTNVGVPNGAISVVSPTSSPADSGGDIVNNSTVIQAKHTATPAVQIPSESSPNSSEPSPASAKTTASPLSPSAASQQPTVRSWSSLFAKAPSPASATAKTDVPTSPSAPSTGSVDNSAFPSISEAAAQANTPSLAKYSDKLPLVNLEKVTPVGVHNDPLAYKVLDQLVNLSVTHTPIVIQPRGLKNGKNTCFLNAPLQVLMGCPPFVHMFRSFKNLPARLDSKSSTPILDSLIQFVNSFQNGQRIRNQGSRNKKISPSDLSVGPAFIPEPLLSVAQNILGLQIGVQHDAEEFLSQILSICNEEMENILKLKDTNGAPSTRSPAVSGEVTSKDKEGSAEDDDDDEAWQQVGPKNHHVETNVNDCGRTPLSSIFAGLSRSCLVKESGKTSDTLDSFFTLKLDIQGDNIHTVKEALLRLNTTETVHDADGRKIHGQRRMFFDTLPPVLIMHLKLFEYSNGNGQKIQKKISFDVDLNIPKETLSRVGKTRYPSPKTRAYKLFGVVNHHGRKMNDGHYTSDVFLPVASGWLRFDDSEITLINEQDVLHYSERSMPYLLFYRRMDVS